MSTIIFLNKIKKEHKHKYLNFDLQTPAVSLEFSLATLTCL